MIVNFRREYIKFLQCCKSVRKFPYAVLSDQHQISGCQLRKEILHLTMKEVSVIYEEQLFYVRFNVISYFSNVFFFFRIKYIKNTIINKYINLTHHKINSKKYYS